MRRLLCTRRQVPLDRVDEYVEAWQACLRAVHDAGGRGWRFRREGHEDHFLEFIEWSAADTAITDRAEVDAALQELAFVADALSSDEWEEA